MSPFAKPAIGAIATLRPSADTAAVVVVVVTVGAASHTCWRPKYTGRLPAVSAWPTLPSPSPRNSSVMSIGSFNVYVAAFGTIS